MKLKPRLCHFWRNNKQFVGMYATFLNLTMFVTLACLLKPAALHSFAYTLLWSIVWRCERIIDVLKRYHHVNKHRCKKYINEMHWRGLKEGHQVGYDSGYDDGFADASKQQE